MDFSFYKIEDELRSGYYYSQIQILNIAKIIKVLSEFMIVERSCFKYFLGEDIKLQYFFKAFKNDFITEYNCNINGQDTHFYELCLKGYIIAQKMGYVINETPVIMTNDIRQRVLYINSVMKENKLKLERNQDFLKNNFKRFILTDNKHRYLYSFEKIEIECLETILIDPKVLDNIKINPRLKNSYMDKYGESDDEQTSF